MRNSYRIVKDEYCGYKVQTKKWWFPFIWFECYNYGRSNTFSNLNTAEEFARRHAMSGSTVKNLGKLP